MKLYTKTGDDGSTGLFGADRVMKDSPRVEAYGTVDELNAAVGGCIAACAGDRDAECGEALQHIRTILLQLQSRLFDIGADLATPAGSKHEDRISRLAAHDVAEAEGWIDATEEGNIPMRAFVLPGGTELAARLHIARTICRRAERCVVTLARHEAVNDAVLIYLNRISDLLFALARRANRDAGVADIEWRPKGNG